MYVIIHSNRYVEDRVGDQTIWSFLPNAQYHLLERIHKLLNLHCKRNPLALQQTKSSHKDSQVNSKEVEILSITNSDPLDKMIPAPADA